ncbi:MAG: hypothetical protein JSV44_07265, partial [Candidatus Zixiibacteriota bacterium]
MKRLALTLFLALLIISSSALANKAIKVEREFGPSFVGYAPNKCIVIFEKGFSPGQGKQALADIAARFQVSRFARQFPTAAASHPVDEPLTRYYKAHFPEGRLEAVMEAYRRLPFVERVEPVGLYRMTATPNDFYYDSSTTSFPYMQWH